MIEWSKQRLLRRLPDERIDADLTIAIKKNDPINMYGFLVVKQTFA